MTKKLSASSQRAKRIRKNVPTISRITIKAKKELKQLAKIEDQHIDYSDISELHFNQLGKPGIGVFYKPIKKQICIRLDTDILAWFKHTTNKYQSLINQICRKYMEQHRNNRKVDKGKDTERK